MNRQTNWYYEDDMVVIADTLEGTPFVVLKDHTRRIAPDTEEVIVDRVAALFGDHELVKKMNIVGDHWHAHITEPASVPDHLANE
jgi:hypothetical protein